MRPSFGNSFLNYTQLSISQLSEEQYNMNFIGENAHSSALYFEKNKNPNFKNNNQMSLKKSNIYVKKYLMESRLEQESREFSNLCRVTLHL